MNKEVGSGITIMGYAGITSQDVAPHSIDIFHEASIAQIQANLLTKTCPVTNAIINSTPVIATPSNFTIPISTPFALTGSATDADAGDILTYCWEQNDNASSSQTGTNSRANPTKLTGPNWLSFSPVTSPTRYFPQLSTILAGGLTTGPLPGGDAGTIIEALSSVSRTLNFRLTVRDNAPYSSTAPFSIGQTQFSDMVVTVTNTSGPFAVSSPNTSVSWSGGSSQTITWAVANTTASPVSCANVKISLSTDGGQTFPTVLAASTPNDGSEALVIPNTPSTIARIKVEAVGNIFFDISNTNFTITSGTSCGSPSGLGASAITTNNATVSWSSVSGASSYDVDYKAASSGTWINAATATTSLSVSLSGLSEATAYDWRVRANCSASSSSYSQSQFTTASTAPCTAPIGLGSSSVTHNSATVSWSAVTGAISYDVQYKTTASASWITAATGTTSLSVNLGSLSASTSYDWRVRTNCLVGSSIYSTAQFTTLPDPGCSSIYDVSSNGTSSGAATIPFNTDITGLINPRGDNDYYRFAVTTGGTATLTLTTLPANYDLRLYSSNGTTQLGASTNNGTSNETITYTFTPGTYYARVNSKNASNATSCYTLTVQLGTATRELIVNNKISAFPNPVSNMVTVKMEDLQQGATIRVFDIYGKMVLQQAATGNNTDLDLSRLSSGVYTLRVMNKGSINSLKIVKD